MNKLLTFVLISAVAFAFVYGQEDYYTSESSDSGDEQSSDINPPSSFYDDSSSSSSSLNCVDGEYNNGTACVPCAELLHCATCSSGRDCETCPPGYVLDSQTHYCVLNCSQFGDGCSFCSQTKCITCNKQACCNMKEWYWNSNASACENPAIHFGKGCLKAVGEECTLCTAQSCCGDKEYFDFSDSTCKSCSSYGESCEKCVSGTCTKCGEGEIVDADGVCKSCVDLFGEGCTKCSAAECTETDETHFIRGSYSIPCEEVFGENCTACSSSEGCTSCGEGEVPVNGFCKSCYPCKTTACSSTGCTECEDGYYLKYTGECIACSKAFGAQCTACTADGCTEASAGYFVSNGFAFDCHVLCDAANGKAALKVCDPDPDAYCPTPTYRKRADGVDVEFAHGGQTWSVSVECSKLSEGCTECDTVEGKSVCTACDGEKYPVGGMCHTCAELHNDAHCLECSDAACTGCDEGWNLNGEGKCIQCDPGKFFDGKTKSCVECGQMYSHCDTCTDGVCSACDDGDGYYLKDGKCKTCMDMYNPACTSCTSTECTACISDECCDDDEHIIDSNGQYDCKTCAEAYEDEKCNDCTATECTSCETGFAKGPSTKCTSCSDLFEGCSLCDEDQCLECADKNAQNLGNGCFIQPDLDSSNPSSSSNQPLSPSSSSNQPLSPSSSSNQPVSPPPHSDDGPKDADVGLIAGIIVAVIVAAIIICVCIFCVVTAGKKHGKVDPIIYEEDPQFISMSVL